MKLDPKQKAWVAARSRHHLSHAHVQMARELGMNPSGLGKLDNHRQEPWKAPLPEFIERLYEKRFGRVRPEIVTSIEENAKRQAAKKAIKKEAKAKRRVANMAERQAFEPDSRPGESRAGGVPFEELPAPRRSGNV